LSTAKDSHNPDWHTLELGLGAVDSLREFVEVVARSVLQVHPYKQAWFASAQDFHSWRWTYEIHVNRADVELQVASKLEEDELAKLASSQLPDALVRGYGHFGLDEAITLRIGSQDEPRAYLVLRVPPGEGVRVLAKLAPELEQLGDIYGRVVRAAATASNEELYRSLVNQAGDILVYLSPSLSILEWNREAEILFGWDSNEVLGKEFLSLCVDEALWNAVLERFTAVLAGEPVAVFEAPGVTRDGRAVFVSWRLSRLVGLPNQPFGIVAAGRDVFEQRRAEEALHLQIDRLEVLRQMQAIFHTTPSIGAVVHEVNHSLPPLLKVSRTSLLVFNPRTGTLVSDGMLGAPNHVENLSAEHQSVEFSISGAAYTSGNTTVENDCLHSTIIPREAVDLLRLKSCAAIPVLGRTRTLGVLRVDDCEKTGRFSDDEIRFLELVAEQLGPVLENALLFAHRDEVEQALQEEKNFVTTILDTATALVVALDASGRVVRFNHSAQITLGYEEQEVLGKVFWEHLLAPESIEPTKVSFQRMLAGEVTDTFQNWWVAKDGSLHLIAWSIGAIRNDDGSIRMTVGTGTDVTERHQQEQEEALLNRVSHELASARSTKDLAEILHRTTVELFGWDAFYLAIRKSGEGRMRMVEQYDTIDGELQPMPQADFVATPRLAKGPLAGKSLLINRQPDEISEASARFGNVSRPSASMMYVPVLVAGQVVGICSVQSYTHFKYGQAEQEQLERICNIVGPALVRCEAERESDILLLLGSRLNAARTSREVAQTVVSAADELTGWDACFIDLLADDDRFRPVLNMDLLDGTRQEVTPETEIVASTLCLRTMKEGPVIILREPETPRGPVEPFGDMSKPSLSLMFAPIRAGGKALGVLSIQSYQYRAYTRSDLQKLEALADYCGGALERTRAEEQLREREQRYRQAISSTGAVPYQKDYATGEFVFVGEGIRELTGYSAEEFTTSIWRSLVREVVMHGETAGLPKDEAIERTVAGEVQLWRADIRIEEQGGTSRWLFDSSVQVKDEHGRITGSLGILQDISDRKSSEEALRESEERYALAVQGAYDGLWDWDLRNDEVYYSPRWKSILGLENEPLEPSAEEWLTRVHYDDIAYCRAALKEHLESGGPYYISEHRLRHADGTYRWVLARAFTVRGTGGKAYRLAGSLTDITSRKTAEEQLKHGAYHDTLTSLPNRKMFLETLGRALARLRRRAEYSFAVLFLDLDRFKIINDSLGHIAGDKLLIGIARRLERCVRPGDTVARLGGDEFTVLLDDIRDIDDATRVATRIQEELRISFNLEGHEVYTTASIGIAISSSNYERAEDLLRDADTAMYRAKEAGKARYQVFDAGMHVSAIQQLQVETELRRAVESLTDFFLVYQPIICLSSGRITGFEALVRWMHPQRGEISPGTFIPIAEETNLIIPLGEWIVREAMAQLAKWKAQAPSAPDLCMAINLSSVQFRQPNFVRTIHGLLKETGADPHSIALEITESELMQNAESLMDVLNGLKDLGLELHVDDFGTGYSSLAYLHRFPIDVLKIDRLFVSHIGSSDESTEIVRAIVSLGHSMKQGVIAEGIEREEHLEQLRKIGCDMGQGYYFSKPVRADEAERLLAEGLPHRPGEWPNAPSPLHD